MEIKKEEMKEKLLYNGLNKSYFTKKRTISRRKNFNETLFKKNSYIQRSFIGSKMIEDPIFSLEEKAFCIKMWA